MDSDHILEVKGLNAQEVSLLFEAAKAVLANAYAPYSNYPVASAILCSPDHVHTGVNVENASYPVCVCAERVAIGSAVTAGHTDFRAILVLTMNSAPVPPCGACRQALFEFKEKLPVIMANADGPKRVVELHDLLPDGFSARDMDE